MVLESIEGKDMGWSCGRLLRASERSFIIRLGIGWETVGW